MTQRGDDRRRTAKRIEVCIKTLKRTLGDKADSVAVRLALEVFAFGVLDDERADPTPRKGPPTIPEAAKLVQRPAPAGVLREQLPPDKRRTVPRRLPRGVTKP